MFQKSSPAPRWRAAFRLARRQALAGRGGSVLMVVLIAIPVLVATFALTMYQSQVPTPQQELNSVLGQSDVRIIPSPHPVGARQMSPTALHGYSLAGTEGDPEAAETVVPSPEGPALPASAQVIELGAADMLELVMPNGTTTARVTTGPAWSPQLQGAYDLRAGAAPTRADEAMVSPYLLQRLDAAVGDTIDLVDGGTLRITGVLMDLSVETEQLFLLPSAPQLTNPETTDWFVSGWEPNEQQWRAMFDEGYASYPRTLAANPPADSWTPQTGAEHTMIIALVWGAGAFLCLLTALLAATALSVMARRQQSSLAVAASVGASRRDLFRIVLLQGGTLAVAGAVLGAAAGIGAAAGAIALLDTGGVPGTLHGFWGLHIAWMPTLVMMLIAVAAGVIAAISPARKVSRGDTLATLRGARRPVSMRRTMPRFGVVALIVGTALAVFAVVVVPPATDPATGYANPFPTALFAVLLVGTALALTGLLLCGHWLLTKLAATTSRTGIATRLAIRDAVAAPARVVPAFTAIAASVFLATTALATAGMLGAESVRTYPWQAPENSVVVNGFDESTGADALPASPDEIAAATQAAIGAKAASTIVERTTMTVVMSAPDADSRWSDRTLVVAADDLLAAQQVDLNASQRSAYENGAVIVGDRTFGGPLPDTYPTPATKSIRLDVLAAADGAQPQDAAEAEIERTVEVPMIWSAQADFGPVIMAPETARSLGADAAPSRIVLSYDRTLGASDDDAIRALETQLSAGSISVIAFIEHGPQPSFGWMLMILAVAGLLVVGAAAVCLGLARFERRSDDATLTAVGADRRVRRRTNAVQALVLTGFGTVPGTLLAMIPTIGIRGLLETPLSSIPWPLIAALAIGLPLLIAAVSWLIPPRTPVTTRRTAIA